jgi:hypothetical protein
MPSVSMGEEMPFTLYDVAADGELLLSTHDNYETAVQEAGRWSTVLKDLVTPGHIEIRDGDGVCLAVFPFGSYAGNKRKTATGSGDGGDAEESDPAPEPDAAGLSGIGWSTETRPLRHWRMAHPRRTNARYLRWDTRNIRT